MPREQPADDACMSDIAAASSIQQSQVHNEIAFAVARKSLDSARAQGDAALSLLQSAADLQQNAQQQPTQRPLGPGQTISVVA